MTKLIRIFFPLKYLILLSTLGALNSCSNFAINPPPTQTTTHVTYDLFNTIKNEELPAHQKPASDFTFNETNLDTKLDQWKLWLATNCNNIKTNWQACLQSTIIIKQLNTNNLNELLAPEHDTFKDVFLALYFQNQAELLLNQYSDRKHKIQAAHLFIKAKTLLESNKTPNIQEFQNYLIHLIELQLSIMVHEDSFLGVIIAPPALIQNNNYDLNFAILNWSAQALLRNSRALKKIRKKSKILSKNACLISLETAIKYEHKLNKKWATIYIIKFENALNSIHSQCNQFKYNNYFFDLVLLSFNQSNWNQNNPFEFSQTKSHAVVTQKSILNKSDSLDFALIDSYLSENPLDALMYIHIASLKKPNELKSNDPCFKLNPSNIDCYIFLNNYQPIKQLKNRDFIINQLVYVFPYELLLHQLTTRLSHYREQLGIQFDERLIMETIFQKQFTIALQQSNFSNYQLKLLYAYYAIFNLSDSFLSDSDKSTITDFFFTQKGYQLKWELTVIVQDILTGIQRQYFQVDTKKPE
ncbi:hypothetical protein [Marinicellulosiphila megalodicopiae]|uniref:hypothetical protein n=1 Tax=Marinicellulosiphila megalodicopiae TaxID=2724896 RepID=UPI003BAE1D6A